MSKDDDLKFGIAVWLWSIVFVVLLFLVVIILSALGII